MGHDGVCGAVLVRRSGVRLVGGLGRAVGGEDRPRNGVRRFVVCCVVFRGGWFWVLPIE